MASEPMSSSPTISAVVCTHNRAAFLRQALDSLAGQTLVRTRYEVIVVNNGSTDETLATVRECQVDQRQCVVRLVDEPALGLGYARNTGWKAAQGDYVAFMDDDARADPGWLERALNLFEDSRPAPIAAGGQVLPWYLSQKPAWYKDEYEVRSWGPELRRLSAGESFSGSNMIFAKNILHQLDGFDVDVGMRGERVSMGEETVLFDEIWKKFGEQAILLYAPDLIVYHAVTSSKMTLRYHLSRWFVTGQVACRLDPPTSFRDRVSHLRASVTAIRGLMRSALEQRKLFSDYRSWMVERLGPVVLEAGRFLAGMGFQMPVRRPELTAQHLNDSTTGDGHSDKAVQWSTR
jgi:glucosyl-dolichyl phosphate glucuronosyltransferase